MVLVWNSIAQGDANYCAILVCVNSILQVKYYEWRLHLYYILGVDTSRQVVLFSPYALLLLNILGGSSGEPIKLDYGHTAISVCIVGTRSSERLNKASDHNINS